MNKTGGNKNYETQNYYRSDGPVSSKQTNSLFKSYENSNYCTEICGFNENRSCGKTLLVDISCPGVAPGVTVRAYAIIDEQSTNSFVTSLLLDSLKIDGPVQDYYIKTMSGERSKFTGRTATGLVVKGVAETKSYELPTVYENDNVPDTKSEVATPAMLLKHPYLKKFANKFAPWDGEAQVHLLIGRDGGNILATKTMNERTPFAHKTALGWAIVGSICQRLTQQETFVTLRTALNHEHFSATIAFPQSVFHECADNESIGCSVDDKRFLNIVCNNVRTNSEGKIEIPLPLKDFDKQMPNNKQAVYCRQRNTLSRVTKNEDKLNECLKFMQNLIDKKHVEKIKERDLPTVPGKVWYLPLIPAVHPRKLKIRLVFDSAASYSGVSLNSALLSGPDQNNKLRGVLCRFREEEVCFVADVEFMFHSFSEHRDCMSFYWYDLNDPSKKLVEY